MDTITVSSSCISIFLFYCFPSLPVFFLLSSPFLLFVLFLLVFLFFFLFASFYFFFFLRLHLLGAATADHSSLSFHVNFSFLFHVHRLSACPPSHQHHVHQPPLWSDCFLSSMFFRQQNSLQVLFIGYSFSPLIRWTKVKVMIQQRPLCSTQC